MSTRTPYIARLLQLLALVFALHGGAAMAATCRVAMDGVAANNGSTWALATTLQDALGNTHGKDCTVIWVKKGRYAHPQTYLVSRNLELRGGFEGNETTLGQRPSPIDVSATILDGEGRNQTILRISNPPETGPIVHITGATLIEGFTVTGSGDLGIACIAGRFTTPDHDGDECSPRLTDLIISHNQRGFWAYSSFFLNVTNPMLTNVTFDSNSQVGFDGLVDDGASAPSLANVTFSNNGNGNGTAYGSGAILFVVNRSSAILDARLAHVTIVGNHAADGVPAGIRMVRATSSGWHATSSLSVTNSILWNNNTVADGPQIAIDTDTAATVGYTLIEGGCPTDASCEQLQTDDPELGPLQDNGGFMPTFLPAIGSPALDSALTAECAATDQRGVARPQLAGCDRGAVERVMTSRTLDVTVTGPGANTVSAGASPEAVSGGISSCSSSGGGNCAAIYDLELTPASQQPVTLTAIPAAGHRLVSWGGHCAGSAQTAQVVLSSNRSCSAAFALNTHRISGTLGHLLGNGLALTLTASAGADNFEQTLHPAGGDAAFAFTLDLPYGASYAVSVAAQPGTPAQTCTVSNGSGTLPDQNVTDVQIDCVTVTHEVSLSANLPGGIAGTTPPLPSAVDDGDSLSVRLQLRPGFTVTGATGCGGSFDPATLTYTTGPVTAACQVSLTLAANVAPVPTLGQWALMLLGALAAGLGLRRLKRHRP